MNVEPTPDAVVDPELELTEAKHDPFSSSVTERAQHSDTSQEVAEFVNVGS